MAAKLIYPSPYIRYTNRILLEYNNESQVNARVSYMNSIIMPTVLHQTRSPEDVVHDGGHELPASHRCDIHDGKPTPKSSGGTFGEVDGDCHASRTCKPEVEGGREGKICKDRTMLRVRSLETH